MSATTETTQTKLTFRRYKDGDNKMAACTTRFSRPATRTNARPISSPRRPARAVARRVRISAAIWHIARGTEKPPVGADGKPRCRGRSMPGAA